MGLFADILSILAILAYKNHKEKNDVSAECEDSIQFADNNGVINIDNSDELHIIII